MIRRLRKPLLLPFSLVEVAGGLAILLAVYLTSFYRYVLFHSLAEMFSVVIACCVFLVYWNSRRFMNNGCYLFVAVAFLCVGLIDLLHVLAYKGMGVFPDDGGNRANELWIAGRYLESLSFLAAFCLVRRRLNVPVVAAGYLAVTGLLLCSIFVWDVFPDCFIAGQGVTDFKTISEFVICGILVSAICVLIHRKGDFHDRVYRLLFTALVAMIASELAFSDYRNPYGAANMVGHLFKIVSFAILYLAFIEEGLRRPYHSIFHSLKHSERALLKNQRALESLYKTLTKKQEFLNAVLDNIKDGIVACDADGVLTLFNPVTREFHGLSAEPLPAEEWPGRFNLYRPDGVTPMRMEDVPLYRALQGDMVRDVEMVIAPKGGKTRRLLADGQQLIVGGKLVGAVVIMHDITDRRQAEESLTRSEQKYRTYINSSPTGVFVANTKGRLLEVNPAACAMLGYTKEELLRKSVQDVLTPDEAKSMMVDCYAMLRTGADVNRECRIVCKNGSLAFMSVHAARLSADRGIGFCVDITERRRAEMEARKAELAAEAASRAKSEFLANMSHEIRTPMTAILGFADILLGNPPQEEIAESAKVIKRNGEHLLDIINDILDLSKIESGKHEIAKAICSPAQIVADVVSTMKVRAEAKGLALTFDIRDDVPKRIQTDPARLRGILVNLIGNAVKFTEVGSVRVVVHSLFHGREPRVRFNVVDTGIGMSTEQIGRIFEPFSQADGSVNRRFGGTGLGLAISKRLATLLGGDITVRSAPGAGSTFSLTITTGPIDATVSVQHVAPEADAAVHAAGELPRLDCRVLLVEDGPDNQRLISHMLRKAGANVTVAENGKVAVDVALKARQIGNPFDAVLMDMQMPIMDGYEATRALRQAGYSEPIIALTAHAMREDRQKCIDVGCDAYVSKPIDRARLLQAVARQVERTMQNADR